MKVFKDRIEITRGEQWQYSVDIVNNDNSPFVISSAFKKPYFLVTIASSTAYSTQDRYVRNYWCPIDSSYKRFYVTQPIHITQDAIDRTVTPLELFNGTPLVEQIYAYIASGGDNENFATYYTTDVNGNIEYWHWTGNEYKPYECPFDILFQSSDTKELIEREYDFGLKLVDGDAENNISFMQVINVPKKLIVMSNIYGSMEGAYGG